ncbi:antifreeze protein [candidate division KSB3 bacterium]|uniref:Antifreeze protein n=1 Tax=candidate division KSB3 bacterium TaxID=2044937 RepID=A0A2G6E3H1_9BACT|nr:MAG: antifreeze protein [candidate division KSB3 bacterium]PIE28880.1 MAG: antifreeze protein [candidate division KSB3 bacterium]
MGLWRKITGEFIEIVEWMSDDRDTMVYRFESNDNEIKNGAQLTVREGQAAVFVNEGSIADVFIPGRYELKTENLPILSKLKGWKYGFESPFKAEVYFVSTRQFPLQKWGLKNPLMLRDKDFGVVRVRAFGTYGIKIRAESAGIFLREIVGTDSRLETHEITNHLRDMLVARFADVIGESKIPVLDLAANYEELGDFVLKKIYPEFIVLGIELTRFFVENISLPKAVEEVLDKRTSMGVIGDLSAYTQFQTAQAMETMAENPGSGSEAMNMGMGFAMGNQMANAMSRGGQTPSPEAVPPPLPTESQYHVAFGGQSSGPFPLSTLTQKVQSGQLTHETLVWKDGMAQWAKAGDVPELASLFSAVPPPLPPVS